MRYEVCFIDDHILPFDSTLEDTEKINQADFERFVSKGSDWSEDAVKDTILLNINNARKFKQIDFYGFTEPNFFLNYKTRNGINPHTIILDYDFGTSKGTDFIPNFLTLPNLENLFFLSANAPVDQIKAEIPSFNSGSKVQIDVFEKSAFKESDLKTQENIIEEYNKKFFEHSEKIDFYGRQYTFHPSSIIPVHDDIWMLDSIIGSEFFIEEFEKMDNIINHETIEKVANNSLLKFYLSRNKKRIYTESGLLYADYFGDVRDELEIIKPIYAIKNFDLFILEQAVEKTYANIEKK